MRKTQFPPIDAAIVGKISWEEPEDLVFWLRAEVDRIDCERQHLERLGLVPALRVHDDPIRSTEAAVQGRYHAALGMVLGAILGVAVIYQPGALSCEALGRLSAGKAWAASLQAIRPLIRRPRRAALMQAAVLAIRPGIPAYVQPVRDNRVQLERIEKHVAARQPDFREGAGLRHQTDGGLRLGGCIWPIEYYAAGKHTKRLGID